jgi:hypothetical protein
MVLAMPTVRRAKRREAKRQVNQAAIDAWQTGDWGALHEALGLSPACFSPLPPEFIRGYGLPAEKPTGHDLDIVDTWDEVKLIQDDLIKIAGPPGSKR